MESGRSRIGGRLDARCTIERHAEPMTPARGSRGRALLALHGATRHGVYLSSFDVLRALRPVVTERVVVLRHGGELEAEFRGEADRVEFESFRPLSSVLERSARTAAVKRRFGLDRIAARATLRRMRPDVVYASNLGVLAYAATAVELGIPTILHVREISPRMESLNARWSLPELRSLRVVAVSRAAAAHYAEATGIDAATIPIVPPAVDPEEVRRLAALDRAHLTDTGCCVVACGSARYAAKGFDHWVAVCDRVFREPDFSGRFIWVGEEPDERSGLVEELVNDGKLHFTGALENPYPTLAAADVVVLPSRREGFSRVLAEAMALARPIVAFATGGVPEVLGDSGVLVACDDVDAMAREVVRLTGDESARFALGAKAVRRVQDLSLREVSETNIRAVVSDCLEDSRWAPTKRRAS